MTTWVSAVKKFSNKIHFTTVAADKYYADFGRATANNFRNIL